MILCNQELCVYQFVWVWSLSAYAHVQPLPLLVNIRVYVWPPIFAFECHFVFFCFMPPVISFFFLSWVSIYILKDDWVHFKRHVSWITFVWLRIYYILIRVWMLVTLLLSYYYIHMNLFNNYLFNYIVISILVFKCILY